MTLHQEELAGVLAQEEEAIAAKLRRYLFVLRESGLKDSDKYECTSTLLEVLKED